MTETPETDRLMARLAEMNGTLLSYTPGPKATCFEDIAREINRIEDQIKSGKARQIFNIDGDMDEPPVCPREQTPARDLVAASLQAAGHLSTPVNGWPR